ncbi:hypothetical protein KTD28_34670 [Burkholderia gladioli]|jgi:hypothetical protein|uniref:hypothetical protein n=1 Tax=Burkholderia gladioli TaxID=28095 RepID=UPI00164091BF|nr:hypothetical protein [Burkholderia gladioli]MBU9159747.1 hypothetical protein [Burkholderia gladioli]MBU9643533.1 hypothetical protein [Burkholderia gladioli]
MTTRENTLYSPQLVRQRDSEMLRVRIERPIAEALSALQGDPKLLVKGRYTPSRSILTRRAIQVYADYVRGLQGAAAEQENAFLHKLA